MQKFLFPFLALALLLSGCGTSMLSYELQFDTDNEELQTELTFAALRIVDRRLASYGEEVVDQDIQRRSGKLLLFVELKDKRIAEALDSDLTEEFTLQFMQEADPEHADIVVEGHGGFSRTGFEAKHIDWLSGSEDPGVPGKGRIVLALTEEGFKIMNTVFTENTGKFIGLFVRDHLAAKLQVDDVELQDVIVISELPSIEMAFVFADDVNVGRYVTFVPIK